MTTDEIKKETGKSGNMDTKIIDLLAHVDFTMGCNGENNILGHIKRLVDFYNENKFTEVRQKSNLNRLLKS